MSGGEEQGALRSIRLHLIAGLAVTIVLAGGLGGWASTAEISGALIAPGQIVVESNVKKVQHPTGGVVGEVLAHDGDLVKAGQVVVRLDDTVTKANLAIVTRTSTACGHGPPGCRPNSRASTRSCFRRCCSTAPTIPTSRPSSPARASCSTSASTAGSGRRRNCASASRN